MLKIAGALHHRPIGSHAVPRLLEYAVKQRIIMLKVIVLEDEQQCRETITESLGQSYGIHFLPRDMDVYKELRTNHYDAAILGLQGQNGDAFDLLTWIKSAIPHIPVIITSHLEKAELIVKAIKQGAFDFVAKPFSGARIRHVVQQALDNRGLKNEIDYLRRRQDIVYDFDSVIAITPIMEEVILKLKRFSMTDSTMLMTGETGTGKSFLSGTVHFNSNRRLKPFIKINSANIPETLLESELFGHEKGAFTGANKLRVGRFEQANGGTLFLDEIGELSPSLQAKLLRVLEEKCFERVGGNKTIFSDVRVIVATNQNLKELISEGKFREDLFYRINVLFVDLPPLRRRNLCIEPLSHLLLDRVCRSIKKKISEFTPSAMEWIKSYSWPGNIRQLHNAIERAAILEDNTAIHKKNISTQAPVEPVGKESNSVKFRPLETHTHEKEAILEALDDSLWIQKDAAILLGITPRTLNYKIKKYGITHPRWRKHT